MRPAPYGSLGLKLTPSIEVNNRDSFACEGSNVRERTEPSASISIVPKWAESKVAGQFVLRAGRRPEGRTKMTSLPGIG